MRRHPITPRLGWRSTVESQGLVFPVTPVERADGTTDEVPYWHEAAWYEFSMSEVEQLEAATDELYGMCREAAGEMVRRYSDTDLCLPSGSLALAQASLDRDDPSVYARFDLVYDGTGPAKMLEINGDTPTGLVETAVAQWNWLEDVFPYRDQWNSVHDRLVRWWSEELAAGRYPDGVHFLHSTVDDSGEEEMTVTYLRDTAALAGARTFGHPIDQLGWTTDARGGRFVDDFDLPVRAAFKLYPWEDMVHEPFGAHVLAGAEDRPVQWLEPAWKMLLSTKAILPVLWEMFPGHPNLLPAYLGEPRGMSEWVAKPLWGREGDNVHVHAAGLEQVNDGDYGDQPLVYQEYVPLPDFDGNRVVLGSWVVGGVAAGCLVRESDGPVTDYYSRVVPHVIGDARMPDEAQVQAWLAE
ncbi:glutathionylspermidine synthase [Isoptericola sp. CG 20/1183]|uniref:Glutathionylspermidine synthase n=1 Tax=Isoptericola halotolerans TaxID=300560 RepID=A0ABX5E959_9MICO|nr:MULTISPECIES: glutathionylspermidine synthase family protein [Isoptericola]MCK0115913.1 glutathionylspermidine synthase family protein [Isoptericola sp. S6320L]PRZ02558.1 glutathionylspermidine synthase [Isoptericola sp. CG 20/1183]PRZ02839.1 glutathionylspermidine synthase [Isoptericola halotolerans]